MNISQRRKMHMAFTLTAGTQVIDVVDVGQALGRATVREDEVDELPSI